MADIPDNTPTRARLNPRHRWPEVVAYRLGTGMVSMLTAAAWIIGEGDKP
ncbi:hypothetical protein GUY44_12005 [Pimelobacter simplex]|nr:hypothetical protein [Pimelobacter simplex]MCG8151206.1 hypothetical protein [Pimelobacter simplex]GEB17200.1 hypothetical protein NSI01_55150 [Pimelobacter simplex]SFN18879.1 hypothetical protein SAMN05421671_0022 [Pimelobacter simplex]